MTSSTATTRSSAFGQAFALLFSPVREWRAIAEDETSSRDVFVKFVTPLAIVGAIGAFIGGQIHGFHAFYGLGGIPGKPDLGAGIAIGVGGLILSLIAVLFTMLIVDSLSPKFGGEVNFENAAKLVAYSYTPVWLAGIFLAFPPVAWLSVLTFYGLLLFYLGAGPMLRIPAGRRLGFVGATLVGSILLSLAMAALTAANFMLMSNMGLVK